VSSGTNRDLLQDGDRAGGDEYSVPATASLPERRPRTLKHGDAFGVFDHLGDATPGPGSPEGLFYRDTRHLSRLSLTLNGERPILLSSNVRGDNATLVCDLTNPDLIDEQGATTLQHDLIHLRRSRFLWRGASYERLLVRNYDVQPQRIVLATHFAADFADIFEVRGMRRARRGVLRVPRVDDGTVTLAYLGLDRVERVTRLRFEPEPAVLTGRHVCFEFVLQPHEARRVFIETTCDSSKLERRAPRRAFFSSLCEGRRSARRAVEESVAITTSNQVFDESVRRSLTDLRMLATESEQGPVPYAGIPWFSTLFGRDALITALEVLWLNPSMARGVLAALAATQATREDPEADAEPGKILHEMRHGEMAALGEVPFQRYYGSVDSTPLFVLLAGAYLERTGDLETVSRLWPSIQAALHWIERHGDRDGDGFVEYGRRSSDGLTNHGWKDSSDSVFHADGTLARGPIALVEVQAYVYGAWRAAAAISRRLGQDGRALEYVRRADDLARRFDACFFDEEIGSYVLALDGDKQPCRVRTSNAGHALFTGIARPERAPRVIQNLLDRRSFCGWGVRTLASIERRYNPMSYHNGSVWPHDNAIVAAGFARYGSRRDAARIFEGLFAASAYMDLRRLPELFCGFAQQHAQGPTFYPVACMPQAWAAAAPLSLLQSCLGLGFDPVAGRIEFQQPCLPDFLDEVVLRGVVCGTARADIAVRRSRAQVLVEVLERHGDVSVVTSS
jgi:glycogen debranching enzyme